MKKYILAIVLILILFFTNNIYSQTTDVPGLTELASAPASTDEFHIIDKSATPPADGTDKKITASNLLLNVNTVIGVSYGSNNLGTFTGSTITDNQTVKAALQLLETSLETKLATDGDGGSLTNVLHPSDDPGFLPDGTLSTDVFVVTDGDGKANDGPAISAVLQTTDVDDTPVNGVTTAPVSSNWAYDLVTTTLPATYHPLWDFDYGDLINTPSLGTISSLNTGTLTNTYLCTYVTGTGLVCNTAPTIYLTSAGTNNVNDTHIDWGTGANQVSMVDIPGTAWRVFYTNGSGVLTELALGADGTYLKSGGASAIPSWDTPAGGGDMNNPMTTQGDIIYGGASGTPTRLALGTSGYVLSAGSTAPEYVNSLNVAINLADADSTNADGRLAKNASDQLTLGYAGSAIYVFSRTNDSAGDGDTTQTWSADKIFDQLALKNTNPMTTTGDVMYASNTATPATTARLAAVALGSVLTSKGVGTAPAWDNAPQITSVNLGHASDTTLARVSAGVVSIEGVNIVTTSSTSTLTNKTLDTAGTGNNITVPLNGVFDGAITDPADADDMTYAKSMNAATITDIYCIAEGGGTITLTLQECDATGASCGNIEGAITCDSDGAEDDGTLTDGAFAANGWIRALFSAPTGTVNSLSWSVKGTQTW